MAVIGLSRNKDTLESVRAAVELAGGLGIKEGSTVLIRPNANTADLPPGSTNPEVLRGAIREARKCNPKKIIVAEKSMTTLDTEMVLRKLGLWQAAEAEGADEVLTFDHMKRYHMKPDGASSWPEGFLCSRITGFSRLCDCASCNQDSLDCNVYHGFEITDQHNRRLG